MIYGFWFLVVASEQSFLHACFGIRVKVWFGRDNGNCGMGMGKELTADIMMLSVLACCFIRMFGFIITSPLLNNFTACLATTVRKIDICPHANLAIHNL